MTITARAIPFATPSLDLLRGRRHQHEERHRPLHSSYPNVVRRHYHPKDVGQSRIGHFGFFNERCREPLWDECLDWLRRSVSASIPTVRIPSRA
jgi:hypothetical protein